MAPPCLPIYIDLGPCPPQIIRIWNNLIACTRTQCEVVWLTVSIDVRLIRDVRGMGGLGCPEIYIRLEAEISKGSLIIVQDNPIVPDVVDGVLASDLASVTVRNETDKIADIEGVECIDVRINLTLSSMSAH